MPDELPTEPGGAPEHTQTPEPTVDYEKRWKDTHANWNQLNEQLTTFQKDPNALVDFIREHHPDLLAEDEDPGEPDYTDEPEPAVPAPKPDPRVDWLAQREADRQFHEDLNEALGEDKIPAKAKDWIKDRTAALGNNKKALAQAVEEFREFAGEIRGPQRREAPTPPQPGSAGEQKYDPRDRNARRARMAAAIEAANQD